MDLHPYDTERHDTTRHDNDKKCLKFLSNGTQLVENLEDYNQATNDEVSIHTHPICLFTFKPIYYLQKMVCKAFHVDI